MEETSEWNCLFDVPPLHVFPEGLTSVTASYGDRPVSPNHRLLQDFHLANERGLNIMGDGHMDTRFDGLNDTK